VMAGASDMAFSAPLSLAHWHPCSLNLPGKSPAVIAGRRPARTWLKMSGGGGSRRAVVSVLMAGAVVALTGTGGAAFAEDGAANGRVWGAAELDFRMYVCGATGKFCPAMTKISIAPARQIDEELARAVSEIPGRVLETAFAKRGKLLPAKLKEAAEILSEKMLPEFERRVVFDPEETTNQYALDYDTYIKWKAVGVLLPQSNDRVLFQKSVGEMMLEAIDAPIEPYDARSEGLDKAVPAVQTLLETAKKRGLIGKFTIDASDYDPAYWSSDSGTPSTSLSFTIDTPVGLQACLQLGGEGAGIKPELIGSAISAYFFACGVSAEGEPYFVDPVYRPNPDDYQVCVCVCVCGGGGQVEVSAREHERARENRSE
jgi:hypothetical protein